MTWLKRTISLLLILSVILSLSAFSAFAEESAEESKPSVSATAEDIAIAEKLMALGIVKEINTETLADNVTRGEMIPLLTELALLDSASLTATTTPFLDVDVFHPQIGAYSALQKLGYISGDENRMFRPNDVLTYNEAITFIVKIMDYKLFAERNGGYPSGYLYTANVYELLDGLSGQGTEAIPWFDVYRLINHALDAKAVTMTNYTGDGKAEFILQENITIAEERYGAKKITGVVTGNENTRLRSSDSSRIGRYQIEIDRVVYDTPEQEYADLLGFSVTAYLSENENGDMEVIYLEERRKKNKTFRINSENIIPSKTTDNRMYYYNEDDKEKHIALDGASLVVIYNGKSRTGYGTISNILPQNGYILALDHTGDEVYDILFINEFQNFTIGSFDSYTQKYYEKYTGETVTIDPIEDDVRVYDAEGKTLGADAITRDAVISVMETQNADGYRLITVYVLTGTVTGAIDEITSDDKYLINGTYYELAENVAGYISAGEIAQPKAGQTAVFTLDMAGRIAHIDRDASSIKGKYAFVMGAEAKGAIVDSVRLKLYTQDGEFLDLNTTNRVTIDGKRYQLSSDAVIDEVLSLIPAGDIIIYKASGKEIASSDTAAPNYGTETAVDDAGNLNLITEGTSFYTKAGICHAPDMKSNKFVVKSGQTIVFYTPSMDKLLEDTEKYSVSKTFSTTKLLYGQYQNTATRQAIESFAVYNLEEKNIGVATCLLLRGAGGSSASGLSKSSKFNVFTKSNDAINEDGENVKRIYYYVDGKEQSCIANEKVTYSYDRAGVTGGTEVPLAQVELSPGDVFQFATDTDGYIDAINVVYRYDQSNKESAYKAGTQLKTLAWLTMPEFSMTFNTNEGEGAAVGKFMEADTKNSIIMYHMDDPEVSYFIGIGKATFEVFRMDTLKGEQVTADALMEGDTILVRSDTGYSSNAAQIIILR
ncbi:MAG: S-layer homology domain-containing protein [Clostridia bacterium]|nr:S-layer homology domain-containing protein [Clostridia bacterium]